MCASSASLDMLAKCPSNPFTSEQSASACAQFSTPPTTCTKHQTRVGVRDIVVRPQIGRLGLNRHLYSDSTGCVNRFFGGKGGACAHQVVELGKWLRIGNGGKQYRGSDSPHSDTIFSCDNQRSASNLRWTNFGPFARISRELTNSNGVNVARFDSLSRSSFVQVKSGSQRFTARISVISQHV
jgi:hypothetical protein